MENKEKRKCKSGEKSDDDFEEKALW
jgi:hypothetical protein